MEDEKVILMEVWYLLRILEGQVTRPLNYFTTYFNYFQKGGKGFQKGQVYGELINEIGTIIENGAYKENCEPEAEQNLRLIAQRIDKLEKYLTK